MPDLGSIKEFGCPYPKIQCKGCKWNYADTCNFDFDSYKQGCSDTTNKLDSVIHDLYVECKGNYQEFYNAIKAHLKECN